MSIGERCMMVQITVNLVEGDVSNVEAVARARHQSQEEIISYALELGLSLLMARAGIGGQTASRAALEAGFGIWKDKLDVPVDGLEYQLAVRAEWP